MDAYETPVFDLVNIPRTGFDQALCQALLNALGEALVALRGSRDLHKGAGD